MSKFVLPDTTRLAESVAEPEEVPRRQISGEWYFAVVYYAPRVERAVVSLPVSIVGDERKRLIDFLIAALVDVRDE